MRNDDHQTEIRTLTEIELDHVMGGTITSWYGQTDPSLLYGVNLKYGAYFSGDVK